MQPILETARLALREMALDDLDFVAAMEHLVFTVKRA
jgi:hypothetical protein